MKTMTVREALRDAMAEEMRRDERRLPDGRGGRRVPGRLQDQPGPARRVRRARVIDTPITEHGFAGIGVGAAFGGLKPIVEFMTFNFAMQAIDQIINSAAKTLYMSGGQMGCPIVFRGPNGAAARVGAQHSQDYAAWYAHIPGLKVIHALFGGGREGAAEIGDPRPEPGDLPRERDPLRPVLRRAAGRRLDGADRQGADRKRAGRRHHRELRDRHDLCDGSGRGAGEARASRPR
jgi:pyruvate dehydrogenase E1 component beta subunit